MIGGAAVIPSLREIPAKQTSLQLKQTPNTINNNMVANPNSNLVFDFPDPSPRFELDDSKSNKSPTNSPIKKNKRFSKLGKKFGIGSNNNNNSSSPSKDSLDGNDTALTSLNSSLNSNTTSPERLQRNNSGDKAAGLSPGNNKQFTFADSPSRPQSTKLNLLPTIGSNPKHVRDPSVASGFISEVSEFSFDRVTVATNDTEGVMTGQSSNVSWNFLDESILQTVGTAAGGLQGGKASLLGDKGCVPYTGQQNGVTGNNNNMAAEANLVANAKAQSMTKRHHSKVSTSTFDNVSLDTEEEDNLFNDEKYGYTSSSGATNHQLGMAKPGDNGSVISEISDRTGGNNAAAGSPDERVKALLREGMAATKANSAAASAPRVTPPSPTTSKTSKLTNEETQNTSKGTFTWSEIKHNYTTFKTSRNNGLKEKSNGSILSSIIEDVQFCGLYFCGIDTTTDNDEAKAKYEESLKLKKMERKREADDTFLGSVISCVPSSVAQCGVSDDARNVFEDSCVPSTLGQCGGR